MFYFRQKMNITCGSFTYPSLNGMEHVGNDAIICVAILLLYSVCYEMNKTYISMFEILEPEGSALGANTAFEGS